MACNKIYGYFAAYGVSWATKRCHFGQGGLHGENAGSEHVSGEDGSDWH